MECFNGGKVKWQSMKFQQSIKKLTIDITIASVPYIGYSSPPAAPALLKGQLLKHGFTATTFEFNIAFRNYFKQNNEIAELISYWVGITKELSESLSERYQEKLKECALKLINTNAHWIGLSVFSVDSVRFILDILPLIKEFKSINQKILLGGQGLSPLNLLDFSPFIDCYIMGDGERSLVELLKGNLSYPGINSPGIQIDNLEEIGWANYEDYDLHAGYDSWYDDSTLIPVTGSKGCVRDCSFCNVNDLWNKFKYRSGKSIAEEIIYNYEKTGHKHFYFTDSLINGNVRELVNMMRILTEYRQKTNAEITWGGQWIARKQRGLPKDYYKLIASSGGRNLTIGVETGSDIVRAHMKKGFTNEDLDAEMEQFSLHGITCAFFIMVGYPTESEEDFNDTLRMLKRYTKYVADGTLIGLPNTYFKPDVTAPLMKNDPDVIHLYNPKSNVLWKGKHSNHLENIRRKLILQKVMNDLGYPYGDLEYEMNPFFSRKHILFSDDNKELVDELLLIKNLDVKEEFLSPTKPENVEVEILLTATAGETLSNLVISHNNKILFDNLVDGERRFKFTLTDKKNRNLLKIALTNKKDNNIKETEKNVVINEIIINGARFKHDSLYFMSKVKYDSTSNNFGNGLYHNGILKFFFKNPTHRYFIEQKKFFFKSKYEINKNILDRASELFRHYVK